MGMINLTISIFFYSIFELQEVCSSKELSYNLELQVKLLGS